MSPEDKNKAEQQSKHNWTMDNVQYKYFSALK
jgi:hypothetical protein